MMPGPFLAFCEYLQSVLTTTKRPTSTADDMPGCMMAWLVTCCSNAWFVLIKLRMCVCVCVLVESVQFSQPVFRILRVGNSAGYLVPLNLLANHDFPYEIAPFSDRPIELHCVCWLRCLSHSLAEGSAYWCPLSWQVDLPYPLQQQPCGFSTVDPAWSIL